MSNKVIAIEYLLTDTKTGEQLDSNVGQEPLEFISGMGQIIPGLESELEKLSDGEKADVLVKAVDAYGEYNQEAVQTLPREEFAGIEENGGKLEVGMTLYGEGEGNQTVQVQVTEITDDSVTIDYNHPLAGKDLMFSVTVISSREATDEEMQTGVIGGMANAGCGCGSHDCEDTVEEAHSCCGGGHCS